MGLISRFFFVFLAAVWCTGVFAAEPAQKPNIILIMADDLGYETLGTYGSASYGTPVLDDLAATGMKFNHCYSQPLCTPSRVKIMTGQYNFRNYTHFGVLPKTEVTFAHILKDAGYATVVAGKWQLYGANTDRAQAKGLGYMPDAAGFDEYLLWQVTKRRKDGERYADPLVESNGGPSVKLEGEYGPDVFTDFLLQFIDDHAQEPFLAYYPMALAHNPFVPTPDNPEYDTNPYSRDNKYFADMVAYMDKVVGRIVAKLDELGIRENTLLLFTGDNGTDRQIRSTMKDGRVIKGNKGWPDDAGTRVPLIANWPGVIKPGVNDNLIDFSDFLPTIVEIAGAKLPSGRVIDGHSFAHQLLGEPGTSREWVYVHYDPRWGKLEPARFARTRSWKLYGDGRFYEVGNDRLEQAPLSEADLDESARNVRHMLEEVLQSYPSL